MHHLTYFNFSTIEHHIQSCEQKQTFLVHGGMECFVHALNFPPSLTNV